MGIANKVLTKMREGGYYSAPISQPKSKEEGLKNFVQMIINDLEKGNHKEALLKAVDLLNDIGSVYKIK